MTPKGVRPFLEATMGGPGADEAIAWMADQHDGTLHAGDFAGVHVTIHSATVTETGTEIPAARIILSPHHDLTRAAPARCGHPARGPRG